jgi:hypothetical protein
MTWRHYKSSCHTARLHRSISRLAFVPSSLDPHMRREIFASRYFGTLKTEWLAALDLFGARAAVQVGPQHSIRHLDLCRPNVFFVHVFDRLVLLDPHRHL